METGGTMFEGGEWSSFNGVSMNEEADFFSQLFPSNCSNTHNELANGSYLAYSNASTESVPFYSSDDSNIHSNFSQGSSNTSYAQESFYLSDLQQYLTHNNTSSLPTLGFPVSDHPKAFVPVCLGDSLMEADDTQNEFSNTHLHLKCANDQMPKSEPADDKSSDASEMIKKRTRVSDKGKRNVRSKKNQRVRVGSDIETNGSSSEEESNGIAISDSNGKGRASRGSATDPQSLYARKRRERINERLRTLQNLVPNGTKVDISTMLEEAVQYVKFLQVQIKLLSSDELWMYAPLAFNGIFHDNIGFDLNMNI